MRNNEKELLGSWVQEHPCERLLDIGATRTNTREDCDDVHTDRRGCVGVTHIKDTENLSSFSFFWQSVETAIISVKINCLSSEFAPKKHGAQQISTLRLCYVYFYSVGGEKGILLQVSVDFYSVAPEEHLQRSGCNIKVCFILCLLTSSVVVLRRWQVFKDKGGDRKQKQDSQKMEKLSPSERVSIRFVLTSAAYCLLLLAVFVLAFTRSYKILCGKISSVPHTFTNSPVF